MEGKAAEALKKYNAKSPGQGHYLKQVIR